MRPQSIRPPHPMIWCAPGNIGSTPIYLECMCLLLWGGQKVGVEAILWSSNSNDSTDLPPPRHFSDVPSPKIAPLSRLLLPQQSPLVDSCLGRVAQRSRASCLSLYAHHHPIIIIIKALSSSLSSTIVINDITTVVILDIIVATSIKVLVDIVSIIILAVRLPFPLSLCCHWWWCQYHLGCCCCRWCSTCCAWQVCLRIHRACWTLLCPFHGIS